MHPQSVCYYVVMCMCECVNRRTSGRKRERKRQRANHVVFNQRHRLLLHFNKFQIVHRIELSTHNIWCYECQSISCLTWPNQQTDIKERKSFAALQCTVNLFHWTHHFKYYRLEMIIIERHSFEKSVHFKIIFSILTLETKSRAYNFFKSLHLNTIIVLWTDFLASLNIEISSDFVAQ